MRARSLAERKTEQIRARPRAGCTHHLRWDSGQGFMWTPTQQGGGPMLVLTRKSNQSIMIGDDIEISVLSVMGEKVRIGIQAPRDIPVFRKEVYLEIQQERAAEAAAKGGARAEVDAALAKMKNSA